MSEGEKKQYPKKTKIAFLYLKEDKTDDGSMYLWGSINGAPIKIFRNGYKREGQEDPDFIGYLYERPKKRGADSNYERSEPREKSGGGDYERKDRF